MLARGVSPWIARRDSPSPGGATEAPAWRLSPLRGLTHFGTSTRGLRPWLTSTAPPGLKPAALHPLHEHPEVLLLRPQKPLVGVAELPRLDRVRHQPGEAQPAVGERPQQPVLRL